MIRSVEKLTEVTAWAKAKKRHTTGKLSLYFDPTFFPKAEAIVVSIKHGT